MAVNLNDFILISPAKLERLKHKIAQLGIDLRLMEEQFVRGGGKGGQKVNKTSNAVVLRYPPLGLVVKVHRERQRSLNRFLALRELVEKAEMMLSPETSDRLREWERQKKQKERRRRRSRSMADKSLGGDSGF